jgi:hypothetical protein
VLRPAGERPAGVVLRRRVSEGAALALRLCDDDWLASSSSSSFAGDELARRVLASTAGNIIRVSWNESETIRNNPKQFRNDSKRTWAAPGSLPCARIASGTCRCDVRFFRYRFCRYRFQNPRN